MNYNMEKEQYLNYYFNKVSNITAVCRSTDSLTHGEHTELEIGKTYTVSHISVLSYSTKIILREFGYKEYSASCFELFEGGEHIEDYTQDIRFLAPYLKRWHLWNQETENV